MIPSVQQKTSHHILEDCASFIELKLIQPVREKLNQSPEDIPLSQFFSSSIEVVRKSLDEIWEKQTSFEIFQSFRELYHSSPFLSLFSESGEYLNDMVQNMPNFLIADFENVQKEKKFVSDFCFKILGSKGGKVDSNHQLLEKLQIETFLMEEFLSRNRKLENEDFSNGVLRFLIKEPNDFARIQTLLQQTPSSLMVYFSKENSVQKEEFSKLVPQLVKAINSQSNTITELILDFEDCAALTQEDFEILTKNLDKKFQRKSEFFQGNLSRKIVFYSVSFEESVSSIIQKRRFGLENEIKKWKQTFERVRDSYINKAAIFKSMAEKGDGLLSPMILKVLDNFFSGDEIINSLAEYISKERSWFEDEANLKDFFEKNNIDNYIVEIRKEVKAWIKECQAKLQEFDTLFQFKLSQKALNYQLQHTWNLTKLILLQDQKSSQEYNKLLEDIKEFALNQSYEKSLEYIPLFLLGSTSASSSAISIKFWIAPVYDNLFEDRLQVFLKKQLDKLEMLERKEEKTIVSLLSHRALEKCFIFHFEGEYNFIEFVTDLFYSQLKMLKQGLIVQAVWIGEFDVKNVAKILNPEFNRYYVKDSKTEHVEGFIKTIQWKNPLNRGGKPYYCPTGWLRFSLNVAQSAEEFEKKWGNWHIAYHGSKQDYFYSILTTGMRTATGCFSWDKPVLYFSPSIEYCAHPRYAEPFQFGGKWFQMILQVRVDPKKVSQIRQETLLKSKNVRIDQFFKNKELEWIVKSSDERIIPNQDPKQRFHRGASNVYFGEGIVVYGIMIRMTDQHPSEIKELSSWWIK